MFPPTTAKPANRLAHASSTGASDWPGFRSELKNRSLAAIDDIKHDEAYVAEKPGHPGCPRRHQGRELEEQESEFEKALSETFQTPWHARSPCFQADHQGRPVGRDAGEERSVNGGNDSGLRSEYVTGLRDAFEKLLAICERNDPDDPGKEVARNGDAGKEELAAVFDFEARVAFLRSMLPDSNLAISKAGKALTELESNVQIFWLIRAQSFGHFATGKPNPVLTLLAAEQEFSAAHLAGFWQLRKKLGGKSAAHLESIGEGLSDRERARRSRGSARSREGTFRGHVRGLFPASLSARPHGSSGRANSAAGLTRLQPKSGEWKLAELWQEYRTKSLALDHALNCLQNLDERRAGVSRRKGTPVPAKQDSSTADDTKFVLDRLMCMRQDYVNVNQTLERYFVDSRGAQRRGPAILYPGGATQKAS